MDPQLALQQHLRESFAKAQERNPRLSLRGFAQRIRLPALAARCENRFSIKPKPGYQLKIV